MSQKKLTDKSFILSRNFLDSVNDRAYEGKLVKSWSQSNHHPREESASVGGDLFTQAAEDSEAATAAAVGDSVAVLKRRKRNLLTDLIRPHMNW